MSQYRPSRSRSLSGQSRYARRSHSLPITTTEVRSWRTPSDHVAIIARKPRLQTFEDNHIVSRPDPTTFWHNYYGRTPSWLRDFRSHYVNSPYTQWWYDPESYRRYKRIRPDPFLDRTDPALWRLTLDPYYDDRNLWRYASKSRHRRADDTALALKLYYEKLITFDDLQRNWLAKRSWWNKTNKKWWNEVGLTHKYVPSMYRFPPRMFYSFDF